MSNQVIIESNNSGSIQNNAIKFIGRVVRSLNSLYFNGLSYLAKLIHKYLNEKQKLR